MKARSVLGPPGLLWMAACLLFCVQIVYASRSSVQFRFEEPAESIRNVYWLDHHKIYDGISSNIGYYGLLLIVYRTVGFSVHTAKYVRAALHVVSLVCLAFCLRRLMGPRRALVPLLAVGLSPTLLYFNVVQTSYGMDLQYLPICLLLIMCNPFGRDLVSLLLSASTGVVAMIACMSFPTFLLYVPILWVLSAARYAARSGRQLGFRAGAVWHATCHLAGLAAPLALGLLWMEHPGMLLYDPKTPDGSGLFRGGGRVVWEVDNFLTGLKAALGDIFLVGRSYHFEVSRPDFCSPVGIAVFVFLVGTSVWLMARHAAFRKSISVWWGLALISLLVPCLSGGNPGLRRCTGVLAGLYAVYVLIWWRLSVPCERRSWANWAGIGVCLLLPLHHVWAFVGNYQTVTKPTRYPADVWYRAAATPRQSVDYLLEFTREGKPLPVFPRDGRLVYVPYSNIFATLAGWRRWNGLPPQPVKCFDYNTGRIIETRMELWDTYYFPH